MTLLILSFNILYWLFEFYLFEMLQEKMRKKKKLKAIKSKNRLITKEVEVTAVQQTWKKFVTKVFLQYFRLNKLY